MKRRIVLYISLFVMKGLSGQDLQLPDTLRTCFVEGVVLDAGPGFDSYTWNTGTIGQYEYADTTGIYSVIAKNGDTVTVYDTAYVVIIETKISQTSAGVDCGDSVMIKVDNSGFDVFWSPGDLSGDSVFVRPVVNTVFYATISEPLNMKHYCVDSVEVTVDPKFSVDSVKQLNMACPGEQITQMQVFVTGDYEPFGYEWSQGKVDPYEPGRAMGLSEGDNWVVITDSLGCTHKEEFTVKAYPLPELELYTDRTEEDQTIVYIQNPNLTFYYENPLYDSLQVDTFRIINYTWKFGDSATSILATAPHTYSAVGTYNVILEYNTFFNCHGEDSIRVEVKPINLKIPNVFTPNGDNVNEKFVIYQDEGDNGSGNGKLKADDSGIPDLKDYYLSNKLVIFNRWGQVLVEKENYENDWDGEGLSDGTYFYILKCDGQWQDDVYKGSVLILRSRE